MFDRTRPRPAGWRAFLLAGSSFFQACSDGEVAAAGSKSAVSPKDSAREEEANWELLYAGASQAEMKAAEEALMQSLGDLTSDYYDRQFDAGHFEVEATRSVTPEGMEPYTLPQSPTDDLCARRMMPDGRVLKVTLPREQFPIVRQINWLSDRIDD